MDLIEHFRDKIRHKDDDILATIAAGIKEELSSKYLLFNFTIQARPAEDYKELVATQLLENQHKLIFSIIFLDGNCTLRSDDLVGVPRVSLHPIEAFSHGTFYYEHPDMLDDLYKAISRLPMVPNA